MYTFGLLGISRETPKTLHIFATMNSWSPTIQPNNSFVFSQLVLPFFAIPKSLSMFFESLAPLRSLSSRSCLIEIRETFKWNILNFFPLHLTLPYLTCTFVFIPIYSLLIPSCCNGRKVHSLESNPLSPLRSVSVDIFQFLYWMFNFSLVGLSFLFEEGWSGRPLDINPHHSLSHLLVS